MILKRSIEMEKYGFVYIWYDRKHKRYYIGCRWGYENDGYICSSKWMSDSYKRRPQDFKRRILSRIYTDKKDLLEEEYKWLSFIKSEELGKRYYNLHNHHFGHWTTDTNSKLTISEKISQKTKEAMQRPDVREKYLRGLKNRDTKSSEEQTREKRRYSMLKHGRNKGKITVKDKNGKVFHTTKHDPRWICGDLVAASKGVSRPPLSEEHRQKLKDTTHFKQLNRKKIKCLYCDFEGNAGNIGRYHNEKCKHKPL